MKNYLLLFSLLISLSTIANAQNASSDGLIRIYPFSGNASDALSTDNNGAVYGATPTFDRSECPNSAYYFDGASSININSDGLNNSNFTFALWAKVSELPTPGSAMALISIGNSGADQT